VEFQYFVFKGSTGGGPRGPNISGGILPQRKVCDYDSRASINDVVSLQPCMGGSILPIKKPSSREPWAI